MNLRERLAALASGPLSGTFVPDKGGSDSPVMREQGRKAKHGGTAPTPQSASGGAAKRAKANALAREQEHGGSRATTAAGPVGPMPGWLRQRCADEIRRRWAAAEAEAERVGRPVGVVADGQTREVLAEAKRGTISSKTMAAYRRDWTRMVERRQTPAEAANSAKHWSRLRAAWIACEVEAITALRAEADKVRRTGDIARARQLTLAAFQRGVALDVDYFQPATRKTWAARREAMKAEGKKPAKRSKRFGPKAPPPETVLLGLSRIRGALARHQTRAAIVALFGLRPAELRKGVDLAVEKGHLVLAVRGAKVDEKRGQPLRACAIPAHANGFRCAAAWLAAEVKSAGGLLHLDTTAADIESLNYALGKIQPGLSCYSFRHAVGSDLKAAAAAGEITQAEAAAFMGHASEKSLSYYGRASNGSKGKGYRAKAKRQPTKAPQTKAAKASARRPRAATQLNVGRWRTVRGKASSPPASGPRKGPRPPR